MESIQGKRSLQLDFSSLAGRMAGYPYVLIDIGTGDGRLVHYTAKTSPDCFAIGIDTCRENLRRHSSRCLPNALYLISPAQSLPADLFGLATHVTVNFPWGSLLESLLAGDAGLLSGLRAVARPAALTEVRLNADALKSAGWQLEAGAGRICQVLNDQGFRMRRPAPIAVPDLRLCPTTWARRLACGRDPRALYLRGERT